MKVTIYDVAREAGLSIATVSRVINGKGGVTPKSEKKIRDAISRLGYFPDASAQGLASSLVNTIGLVLNGSIASNYYYIQFLDGAEHAARERGFDLLLMSTYGTPVEFARSIQTRRKIDGILFANFGPYVQPIYESGFPVSYAGRRQPFDVRRVHVYGGFSGYRKEALSLLFSKGCRQIIYLDNKYPTPGLDAQNEKVIEEFVSANGLKPSQVEYMVMTPQTTEDVFAKLEALFASDKRPDGIFCVDDNYCPQLYNIALKCNLSIPKDLKVVTSIHNLIQGKLLRPALTAYLVDAYQMGYNAIVKLIQIIQGGIPDDQLTYVPYSLIERDSV